MVSYRRGVTTATSGRSRHAVGAATVRPTVRSAVRRPGGRAVRSAVRAAAVALAAACLAVLPVLPVAGAAADSGGLEPFLDGLTARQGADYAVLLDTSGSMQSSHAYQQALAVLPKFLDSLTDRDRVCLIPFSADTTKGCGMVSKEAARGQLENLPQVATGNGSDLGKALKAALDGLRQAGAETAGVLLLSDAEINAADDPAYASLASPGWKDLRQEATGEDMTGYGLPFGNGSGIEDMLSTVFPRYQMLDPSGQNLGSALAAVHDDTRITLAKEVVAADKSRGISYSWPDGSGAGTLRQGSTLRLRLTATTASLPVRLTGVRLAGLPGGVRLESGPSATIDLKPGAHQDVDLRVSSWQSHREGVWPHDDPATWHLSLTGTVTSPAAGDVRKYLGVSPALAAHPQGRPLDVPAQVTTSIRPVYWAVPIILLLLIAAFLIRMALRAGGPAGVLIAEGVDGQTTKIRLGSHRRATENLDDVVRGASVRVTRLPGPHGKLPPVMLSCRLPGRDPRERECREGQSVMLCGIEFHYDTEDKTTLR